MSIDTREAVHKMNYHDYTMRLTKREIEIIRLIAVGFHDHEIAQQLGTSSHTVKNQVFAANKRLGLRSRVQLALYAERCGLLKAREVTR